jgi:hypothetical protein
MRVIDYCRNGYVTRTVERKGIIMIKGQNENCFRKEIMWTTRGTSRFARQGERKSRFVWQSEMSSRFVRHVERNS